MSAPEPYFTDGQVSLYLGDCLDVLAGIPDCSIDSIVTDPPYALTELPLDAIVDALGAWLEGDRAYIPKTGAGFMGRDWDKFVPPPAAWEQCLRVLKPGGHLLAFAAPRTQDLMAMSVRLAGFEIRDGLAWIFGQGYPKSLDVSKAIDKAAGAAREVLGAGKWAGRESPADLGVMNDDSWQGGAPRMETAPATDDAARWDGWGTALKPAHEPIIVARKPVATTVARNVVEYGTGALNVAACRVGSEARINNAGGTSSLQRVSRVESGYRPTVTVSGNADSKVAGRWPPNVLLSEEAAGEMDRQSGVLTSGANPARRSSDKFRDAYGEFAGQAECVAHRGTDSGGASRFFPVFRYQAKAPASERPRLADGTAHNTVKPLELMRWLVRLVTPPGGTVGDFFAGSGTTGEACVIEGFNCILAEKDPVSAELIKTRLSKPIQPVMFGDGAA